MNRGPGGRGGELGDMGNNVNIISDALHSSVIA